MEGERDTLEVIWNDLLRKMVKGGYDRINAPTDKDKQREMDREMDWLYKISNERLREMTHTLSIWAFCY